jgi:hypothetical protein
VYYRSLTKLFQAFDQQQQDLIDTASEALSYRQDIIEENIRLTYALQVDSDCWDFIFPSVPVDDVTTTYLAQKMGV